MHPRLLTLPSFDLFGHTFGPWTLHTYGVLLALAFLTGLWLASRQARRAGLDASKVADLGVYALIAGLLGAKALLVVTDWSSYRANPRQIFDLFQSGGVFYGGLLVGIPVALWLVRRYDLPAWPTADALAPGVILGQAIGRLGCLAAGCCYGRPSDVAWALPFRDAYLIGTVGTPVDVALHPTQLYEASAALLILTFLLWLAPRKRFHGQVVVAYLVLYSSARFAIEFYRGDPRGSVTLGPGLEASTSQLIAAGLLLITALLLPYLRRTQRIGGVPQAPAAAEPSATV
jgi:phosphatidylglycerol:prolipoprotein diacylglycerol transferase